MNLIGAQREYDSQEWKNLSLNGETIASKIFESCVFTKCTFRETTFQYCVFRQCAFKACDFGFAHFPGCSFAGASFEGCQLIGINWTEADWPKTALWQPISFRNCALNHSVLMGLNLKAFTLAGCVARDVDFSDCDLTRADCTSTDFAESRFVQTNLTEADFTGATNYTIAANLNTLRKTKFSLPEAMSLLYSLDIVISEE